MVSTLEMDHLYFLIVHGGRGPEEWEGRGHQAWQVSKAEVLS